MTLMTQNSSNASGINRPTVRLLIAIPVGLAIAVALFCFMSWMVGSVKTGTTDNKPPLSFDMVMQEQDSMSQRRMRKLPEPPKVPDQPQPMSTPAAASAPMAQAQAPQVEVDMNMEFSDTSVDINMPSINVSNNVAQGPVQGTVDGIGEQQQAMPLYRAEPTYPSRLLKRRVEGFVVMSFTINEEGRPEDIEVVEAEPTKAFARPAIQALRGWKYQPKIENGKAVKQGGQQVKIEFKISK